MGCTPSTQQYDDDYSVDSSSDGEDTAGSTARSPRSSQRDVRHWRKGPPSRHRGDAAAGDAAVARHQARARRQRREKAEEPGARGEESQRHREGSFPRRFGAAPAADDPGRLADVRPDRWTVTLVFTTTRAVQVTVLSYSYAHAATGHQLLHRGNASTCASSSSSASA